MQVELENLGKLERKLTVKIPAGKLDTHIAERVTQLGRDVRLKGFRPGKVPRSVIEKRYGAQIRGEALSDLIGASFREAVDQEKLQPAAAPAINTSGKPVEGEISYTATFEVMPELPEVDLAGLKLSRPVASIEDADIDRMIETLREQRRSYNAVPRAAAKDDLVLFEFHSVTGEGRYPEEGGERGGVVLGSGQLHADIEEALIGKKAGDEVEVEATFEASFRVPALAGKLATFHAKVLKVEEPTLPEFDKPFIESFGIEDGDVETFRDEVRRNLEREMESATMGRLKAEVATRLAVAHSDIDVPKIMVANEVRRMAGLEANQQIPTERFNALQPVARQRVIAALLLGDIAKRNEMQPDEGRVARSLAQIASTYEEPEQVIELYHSDPQLMAGMRNRVLEEQVAEWVAEQAQCEDNAMSFDQLMRPAGA